jgi:hypothetical protein
MYGEGKRSFEDKYFWARGIFVSKICRDEHAFRDDIKNRGEENKPLEKMNL